MEDAKDVLRAQVDAIRLNAGFLGPDAVRLADDIEAALEEIAELERRLVAKEVESGIRGDAARDYRLRAEAAEAREAKLREALRHYGTHRLPGCHYAMAKTCQCGLAAALAEEEA